MCFMQVLTDNFANAGLIFIIFPLSDISSFNHDYLITQFYSYFYFEILAIL